MLKFRGGITIGQSEDVTRWITEYQQYTARGSLHQARITHCTSLDYFMVVVMKGSLVSVSNIAWRSSNRSSKANRMVRAVCTLVVPRHIVSNKEDSSNVKDCI